MEPSSDTTMLLVPMALEELPSDNIPPHIFSRKGNTMALTLPMGQARVPSTLFLSGQGDALGPTALEVFAVGLYFPPHCSRGRESRWR
jgi:hypothetical protein